MQEQRDRGQLIVSKEITKEHLATLSGVDVHSLTRYKYRAHVRLSAWKRGSQSDGPQVLTAVLGVPESPGGILVYDPKMQALQDVDRRTLRRLMGKDEYLYRVAAWMSSDAIAETITQGRPDRTPVDLKLEEGASKFTKFDTPKKHGFGLNNIAGSHIGDVEFDLVISFRESRAEESLDL